MKTSVGGGLVLLWVTRVRGGVKVPAKDQGGSRCVLVDHMTQVLQSHAHLDQTNIPSFTKRLIQSFRNVSFCLEK